MRLKSAVSRPEGLEPVSQGQKVLALVVGDADEVVEEGSREVGGDGGVAAEAGDDVPGLIFFFFFFCKGKRKGKEIFEFFEEKNPSSSEDLPPPPSKEKNSRGRLPSSQCGRGREE